MQLARTVVRMMGRRLALRKGVAVSVAVLLLLGWGLLYLSLTRGKSPDAAVPPPALPVTEKETSATPNLSPRRAPVHKNQSVYPAHLRSPPANPAQWGNHSIVHHQQCKFTEVTEVTGVDVQVRRLLDDISPPTLLSSCRCWTLSRRFHLTTQMEVCGNRGLRSVTLLTAMETNLSMYLLFLTPTMTQV